MELLKRLQCNLTNVINMGHIQTYASVLSTEELTMHLKQDREKWRAMFHTCIKLFTSTPLYVCIYYVSSRIWSTPPIARISQEQDRHNICNHENNSLQLVHLGTWWTKLQRYIVCQRHDLPYSHCGSRYGTLFSWLHQPRPQSNF